MFEFESVGHQLTASINSHIGMTSDIMTYSIVFLFDLSYAIWGLLAACINCLILLSCMHFAHEKLGYIRVLVSSYVCVKLIQSHFDSFDLNLSFLRYFIHSFFPHQKDYFVSSYGLGRI